MGCNIKPPVVCSPNLPRDCGSRDPSAAPPPCAERPSGTAAPARTSSCAWSCRARLPRRTPRRPRPAPSLWCASRRTTGPFAEQWCVRGTFPHNRSCWQSNTHTRSPLSPLGNGASPTAPLGAGGHLRPSPTARRSGISVRGRRGQIGSILRDLPRCIRGDRGPAGRRQPSPRRANHRRSPTPNAA